MAQDSFPAAQPGDVTMDIGRIDGDKPQNDGDEATLSPLVTMAQDDGGALLPLPHKQVNRRTIVLWVVFGVCAFLVALCAGWFGGASWYYQGKAALGVSLGDVSVAGQNADQLKATVKRVVADSQVSIKDNDDKEVTASLSDLGVHVDVNRTVDVLLNTKNDNAFAKVNPFDGRRVPLTASIDRMALDDYLATSFVRQADRAVASSVSFDGSAKAFVATEGKAGRAPEDAAVRKAVETLIANPGSTETVSVGYRRTAMPIALTAAQKAADEANARLGAGFVITNGNARSFQVPVEQVAAWITPVSDPSKGTITLSYDRQKVVDYMASALPEQLNQTMVTQEDLVDNGVVILTKTAGVDGVTVKNTDRVADQVYDALTKGQGGTIQAEADVTRHDVKQTTDLGVRIVVDKAAQVAHVYMNNQVVRTFNVCTGSTGWGETDNGTFRLYLKYTIQDMRGLNQDGSPYLSKGVKWVSYFNGGEGFHTASWNYGGIAAGDPVNHGSHGCVNMVEQDAKWIFDNCPEGTLVQVVGAQPTGPVR